MKNVMMETMRVMTVVVMHVKPKLGMYALISVKLVYVMVNFMTQVEMFVKHVQINVLVAQVQKIPNVKYVLPIILTQNPIQVDVSLNVELVI